MYRKIVTPTSENYQLYIPQEYINKKIEILVLPFPTSEEDDLMDIVKNTAGILANKDIDPIKWQDKIRNEYER